MGFGSGIPNQVNFSISDPSLGQPFRYSLFLSQICGGSDASLQAFYGIRMLKEEILVLVLC